MELWQQIIEAYPEINASDDFARLGIYLQMIVMALVLILPNGNTLNQFQRA
jgi:hypothetical protein